MRLSGYAYSRFLRSHGKFCIHIPSSRWRKSIDHEQVSHRYLCSSHPLRIRKPKLTTNTHAHVQRAMLKQPLAPSSLYGHGAARRRRRCEGGGVDIPSAEARGQLKAAATGVIIASSDRPTDRTWGAAYSQQYRASPARNPSLFEAGRCYPSGLGVDSPIYTNVGRPQRTARGLQPGVMRLLCRWEQAIRLLVPIALDFVQRLRTRPRAIAQHQAPPASHLITSSPFCM